MEMRRRIRKRRKRRKRILVLLLLLLILAVAAGIVLWIRYGPSKEKADKNEYFGINATERNCPNVFFYPVPPEVSEGGVGCSCNECEYMKMNTLIYLVNY